MSKLIIVGDVHLGKGNSLGKEIAGELYNSRTQDQIDLLNYISDYSISNKINHVFVTGDIFEEHDPPLYLVTILCKWIRKLLDSKISVHIIRGNHDLVKVGDKIHSSLDFLKELNLENLFFHTESKIIELGNQSVVVLPYEDRKTLGNLKNKEALELLKNDVEVLLTNSINKPIVIGHLALEGSFYVGDEFDEMNELFCPLSMFENTTMTWMGHVHSFQIMKKTPTIAHIGSMDVSNFKESSEIKNIVVIENNKYSLHELPNRKLKKIKVDLPENEDPEEFIKKIISENDVKDKIVKIEISSSINQKISKSKIEDLLIKQGVKHIATISDSKKQKIVKNKQSISHSTTIHDSIKKYAEERIEEANREDFLKIASEFANKVKGN